jgi:hypothetical protein
MSDEQVLREAINAIEADLENVLRAHARAGAPGRVLRHSVCELLGSLIIGALSENADARTECATLVQSLASLITPVGDRAC